MKVIERYILRRTFVLFAATLLWTLAVVWTTQVLSRINLVTDSGQSALTFFEIASLILPSIIPIVVPFAVVIGVAQTLSVMNADSEMVVVTAAGSPRRTIIRPVMLLATLAALFAFVVDNVADPIARQRGRELVAAARGDLLSTVIQEGTFRKIEDGLFIQIGERLPDGGLGGIFVVDSREAGVDLVYYARTGTVVQTGGNNLLVMHQGEIHRKIPGGDASIIRFTSYAFDLSLFSAATEKVTMFAKDRTLPYLFNPDPNDPVLKSRPQTFRAEIHRRFTDWMYSIVFALIALAVAGDARSHREARINPLVTAITIALVVRWMGFLAGDQVKATAFAWPAVYVVPLGAALTALLFIRANKSMELPLAWTERLKPMLKRLANRMMFLHFFRSSRQTAGGGAA